MRTGYTEGVARVSDLDEAFEWIKSAALSGLVLSIGGEHVSVRSLLPVTMGKEGHRDVFVAHTKPALSAALRKVAKGYYLVIEETAEAITPRSLVLYMLERGFLSRSALIAKLEPHAPPCLTCNSSVKSALRVFAESGAVLLPVCYGGRPVKVISVVDLAYLAHTRGREALFDPALRVSGVAGLLLGMDPVAAQDEVESLRKYSALFAELGGRRVLFDASSLQKALPSIVEAARKWR